MLTIIVIMALLARDVPSSVEKPNIPNNELEETIFNFSKVIKANERQTNNYVDRSIPKSFTENNIQKPYLVCWNIVNKTHKSVGENC